MVYIAAGAQQGMWPRAFTVADRMSGQESQLTSFEVVSHVAQVCLKLIMKPRITVSPVAQAGLKLIM